MHSVRGSHAEPIGREEHAGVEGVPAYPPLRLAAADSAPARTGGALWVHALKRAIDVVAATLLLVLTAPLSLFLAVLIKREDGGPVLFRQPRVGRNGAIFILCKFRSMGIDAEAETGPVWAQANDPRVTRVGAWMRPFGIDEIPQAWNVLRGDMSFVGPRPERPEFIAALEAAIPFYAQRHLVRPGITGWAQINLPYGATVEDARHKLRHDLYYVRHSSIRLDLTIMARTLRHAARRRR
jgi:lipopolysaccharide/colanic/teichoic acid biosynthesis glycosyltransferase